MHCTRCNTHFQWSGAPGSSFLTPEIKRELEKAEKKRQQQIRLEEERFRKEQNAAKKKEIVPRSPNEKKCPSCGKFQTKTTNSNTIDCTSCKTRFCFCCRTAFKGSQHFTPGGPCKQHS